jgi:hypothetical protein
LECQAVISHNLGSRIEFLALALAKISLEVSINYGRGLLIRWLEERKSQAEWMELSDSTLTSIETKLRSLCGGER